jgi:ABC-type transporter Mla subunit MlaD
VDVIGLAARAARIPAGVAGGIAAAPDRARQLWGQVEATVSEARSVLARAGAVVDRAETDLDEAARGLRPEQVRSLGRLLDLVPDVLDQIEPALRNLADLAPELEQVTERVDDVGQIIEGLPGAKVLRRRGRAKENDDG